MFTWEAIKWVSSGLTLAAFLAACFVYFRVKSLETDRDILKGTDDAKKLPILQALREQMPLRFENLDPHATERLALQELQRFRDRDRRGFVALLVGLVLMACVICFSIWRTEKAKEPTKSAESQLSVEYARLFGAVETPILVQIQSQGGRPFCNDEICNFSDPTDPASVPPSNYDVQSGHFAPSLGNFWTTWPYKAALPIATNLWKTVARNGSYGIDLLNQAQSRLGTCILSILVPYDEDPSLPRSSGKPNCQLTDSKRVGFLFLILKNISDREMRDISITYLPLSSKTEIGDYLQTLQTDSAIGAKQQTLAGLKSGESAILLVSIYDKDSNGFESKFLTDGIVPREVSFVSDGRKQSMIIRSPRREKAFVAALPNGWYLQ